MSGAGGKAFLNQNAEIVSPITAFGEIKVAQNTGHIYGQFAYNINSELFTDGSTAAGSLSVANGFCLASSGASAASEGKLTSIPVLEYHPGTGGLCRFTAVFDTAVAGNTQLAGLGNDDNGFFIGFNGTTFSILRRRDGTDHFTPQSSFSEDTLDGTGLSGMTLNPQNGNVFQIQYQWLGFGEIRFSIEDPVTGMIFVFHKIKYANQNTEVSILNPTLPFQVESVNAANTSDIVLSVASLSAYSEGLITTAMHLVHAADNLKTGITTETNVLTIRNNATYAGVTNLVRVSPKIFSASADGSKPVVINFYKNTALGGAPSFTDFNAATSVVAIDTAGTTITGGIKVASFSIGRLDNFQIDVSGIPLILAPGDTLTMSAQSANATEAAGSITWGERFS